ncbi:MAG: hypothetical protein U5N85_08020 [Arcicella sp.]|nr:hypothetical protein [Arcicella sp.]
MKEIVFAITIFILFFIASIFFQKRMIQLNKRWLIISLIIYIVLINVFFDMLLDFMRYLKTIKIYFDFGHANLLLIILYFLCMAAAMGFVVNIFILRNKIRK